MARTLDPYGLSRVIRPAGVLPQAAEVLDPSLPAGPDELVIDVDHLNIDAASFKQIKDSVGAEPERIAAEIERIVSERGKMHNPVTGSGGMLIGRIREIGAAHPAREQLQPGDRIATLVSLTLTPLRLEAITKVHVDNDRVDVKGHAILFASGIWAKLPEDMADTLSLAALDVCGAPALVERAVSAGQTVLVLGSGKSGALCCAQAKDNGARVLALDISQKAVDTLVGLGLADEGIVADATKPVEVLEKISAATGGKLCDVVINCASVPRTEMGSILATKDRGRVVFFSMATSFTATALGAEGVGKDVDLLMGNGFAHGHAELTLDLLRKHPALRRHFEERFA
ncbi:zinc-binding dehydrogenase [Vulgatibacter incomptus]|uniref:3,5-diaminohexanoate dehydrogenase n=1 Tax=Vulgatibacter incomptus TaxID=1391653 RepID=A0A0K1PDS6_9BACT|nr:zinc-binding dehydrogenase [Vulgatibacter incomptus]AKU91657.1 3,5-diaminohexanoate dehydrogenase [Vulgatibacter incomptus]